MSLSEANLIQLMKEEYQTHLETVIAELSEKPADGMKSSSDDEDQGKEEKPKDKEPRAKISDLAVDTRLKHVSSGYEYNILRVSSDGVQLSNPESKTVFVDKKTLEKEYVVD